MLHAGAQALVAWSLQNSFGAAGFQMVAEEDSADLRCAKPLSTPHYVKFQRC